MTYRLLILVLVFDNEEENKLPYTDIHKKYKGMVISYQLQHMKYIYNSYHTLDGRDVE